MTSEKMDKKNSSYAKPDELLYLNPPNRDPVSFRPQLLTPEEMELDQVGVFRGLIWPAFKENPLVPIGLTMTVGALGYGLYCMVTGQRHKSQIMMRYRVGFQFLTLAAIMGGFYYRDHKRQVMQHFAEQGEEK